ncbi:MAG: transporter substrate-binding domain-containing protein [Magnetococcales bacterium]|nr:transporter substrate-binding domain-containing protein [Magnetococcales bacterium]
MILFCAEFSSATPVDPGRESLSAAKTGAETDSRSLPADVLHALESKAAAESKFKLGILSHFVQSVENQVLSLAESEFTRRYAREKTEADRNHLTTFFHAISSANLDYMQVRFLNAHGLERVRIDRYKGQILPTVVDLAAMQDKSAKSYFQGPKSLPQGKLWHSKLNLNMEKGEIEKPIRPTFRISTPVFVEGSFRGVVVINLMMDRFLEQLGHSADFDLFLIDQDGEIILHPDPDKRWSRYLPGRNSFDAERHGVAPSGLGLYAYPLNDIFKNREGLRLILIPKKDFLATLEIPVDKGKLVALSDEEKRWIATNPTIRTIALTDWPPVDYQDANGEHTGIASDILKLVASRVGLKVEPQFGPWGEMLGKLKQGQLDLAPEIYHTEERALALAYSRPFLPLYNAIFTDPENSNIKTMADLTGKSVAVEKGYAMEGILKSDYPGIHSLVVESTLEALKMVSIGKAEAYVGSQYVAAYLIDQNLLPGVKAVALIGDKPQLLHMAVPKDRAILRDILDKALGSISEEEKRTIIGRYLSLSGISSGSGLGRIVSLTESEKRWIEQHRVKVGVEEWAPVVFTKEDGRVGGLAGAYLDLLSERTGLKLEIVSDAWQTLLTGLQEKNIDLLPATYYTDERATYGLYSKPYFFIREFIYVKEGSPITAMDDLAKGRIAVVKGYGTIPKLKEKYPQAVIVETQNLMDSISKVLNGEVDAMMEVQMAVEQAIKTNAIIGLKAIIQTEFAASSIHLFSRDDEPLLQSILQKGLDTITEEEEQAIQGKWINIVDSERDKVRLTSSEKQWLSEHHLVRLGIDNSWPPIEFVDEKGAYAGVSSGYVEALERRLNVAMEPVTALSWVQVIEKVKQGKLDLLPAIVRTPERETFLNFTQPYVSFPMGIVNRKGGALIGGLDDLQGKRVGVVKGNVAVEWLTDDYPAIQLVEKTDVAQLLQDLDAGTIDAVVDSLGVISYEMERLGLSQLQIAAPTSYDYALSMGVRKDWPELVPILDKALASLDTSEKKAIKNTWMAHQIKLGLDIRTILFYAVPAVVVSLTIILIIVIWNRRMRREISHRQELEIELTKLSRTVEQSPLSIVITDRDANIEFVNPQFSKVSGYSQEEAIGSNPRILKSGEMDSHLYQDLWQTLSKGKTWKGEFLNKRKSGELYWEATTISPLRDRDGNISHFVANKEDITQRKMADDRLKDALAIISSSIQYASRIQRSIMPPTEVINTVLPQHCLIWEPRDVVGGDMYWYRPWFNGSVIILGDCTGHGVPGAFMTLIANGALDQAILEVAPGDTGTLIQRMHQLIQLALGQDKELGDSDDGLELGVCFINKRRKKMVYSGARFSLFIVDEGGVQEIKGDKSGIGYRGIDRDFDFTAHTLAFGADKRYYMTSDGIIDQIGGEKKRSFGKRRFMRLLETLRDRPMDQQEGPILQALIDYQGDSKRRDDVSLIGFEGF